MLNKKERVKIRNNLKKIREKNGLTQIELSKILKISIRHYQAIENGERIGSIAIWDKLEDLFNIPQRQLRELNNSSK